MPRAPSSGRSATLPPIVPGQPFDPAKLDPAVAKGINAAVKPALDKIASLKEAIVLGDAKVENG